MSPICTEGIVIKSIDFRDSDRIITVFSRDHGLIKLMVRRARLQKKSPMAVTVPLACAEFIYTQRKGEIFPFKEGSLIAANLQLRCSYSHLESACRLIRLLEESQEPGKPAPQLYQLLRYLLSKLHEVPSPEYFIPLFQLRILKHDGHYAADHLALFDSSEKSVVQQLAEEASFSRLMEIEVPELLTKKVEWMFKEKLELSYAKGGTRTPTRVISLPPQGSASTNSATSA